MRSCPKCSSQFDDQTKICRTCGNILDELLEELPAEAEPSGDDRLGTEQPSQPELPRDLEELGSSEPPKRRNWCCPQCEITIPAAFDICWKCGSDKQGEIVAFVAEEPPSIDTTDPPEPGPAGPTQNPFGKPRCVVCGSSKMVPEVRVVDQGQQSDGRLYVVVFGDPDAMLFKDRLYGEITADVCGSCGHLQLRVVNPGELYRHYRRSLQ
jgi:hypothetical protein